MAPIHLHASKGRVDKVEELLLLASPLEAAHLVNLQDAFGNTPVMSASYRGHEAVIQLLAQHGADLNARDRNGRTALMWAAREGRKTTVELLIRLGADVTLKEHSLNSTAEGLARGTHVRDVLKRYRPEQLHAATKKGDALAVERLLQSCPALLESRDEWGNSPLMSAAYRNEEGLVDLLLAQGADINARDREGRTALVWASWKGLVPVVQLLLCRGADVRLKSHTGMSALSSAARSGNLGLVRLLMEHGAEVDEVDGDGRTPLMAAAFAGDLGLMDVLLSYSADVELADLHGMSALMFAAAGDHTQAVVMLARRGAQVDAQNKDGWTALLAAAKRDNRELVEALLGLGANIHIANDLQRDKFGHPTSRGNTTPLSMAARHGKLDMVRCLVGHGADIYGRDGHGMTPEEAARKEEIKTFLRRCREYDAKIYAAAERGDLDETRRLFLASPYYCHHDHSSSSSSSSSSSRNSLSSLGEPEGGGWADRALFLAASWGDEFRVRLWLRHGARTCSGAVDRLGRTLLQAARTDAIVHIIQEATRCHLLHKARTFHDLRKQQQQQREEDEDRQQQQQQQHHHNSNKMKALAAPSSSSSRRRQVEESATAAGEEEEQQDAAADRKEENEGCDGLQTSTPPAAPTIMTAIGNSSGKADGCCLLPPSYLSPRRSEPPRVHMRVGPLLLLGQEEGAGEEPPVDVWAERTATLTFVVAEMDRQLYRQLMRGLAPLEDVAM